MKCLREKRNIVLMTVLPFVLMMSACDNGADKTDENESDVTESEVGSPQYVIPETLELAMPEEAEDVVLDTSNWVVDPPFYAAGQEPFWRLELNNGWFVFQRLGLPEIEAKISAPEKSDGADSFVLEAMTISIRAGECVNAQANEPVRGSITVFHDDVSYHGCVYKGETQAEAPSESVDEAANSNWTKEIGIYAIESDACFRALDEISDGASRKAMVTAMQSRDEGLTAFVLQTAKNNQYLCIAREAGGVESMDALSDVKREDWMNVSGRFMRVESGPPPRACLDAEAVMVDNQLTGYLLPRNCRPQDQT